MVLLVLDQYNNDQKHAEPDFVIFQLALRKPHRDV